jgi:hypothetical protein
MMRNVKGLKLKHTASINNGIGGNSEATTKLAD